MPGLFYGVTAWRKQVLLTRHWRDTPSGQRSRILALATDNGPLQVTLPPQGVRGFYS